MSDLLIDNVKVMQPGEGIVGSSLLLRDGKVAQIGGEVSRDDGVSRVDGEGRLLTPGLMDVHTHGVGHYLYEQSPVDLVEGVGLLGRFGTTCVLPTFYAVLERSMLSKFEALAKALGECQGVSIPGFHLEGPFLALPGAGAATLSGDVGLLDEILAAAHGSVAAMSISPDTPNILPVIERLMERGIKVFMTHTHASVDQTLAAIDAGASHGTHFYDVFPVPAEVDPGVRPVGAVETILADSRVSVDFICDGVHVHPMAIKAGMAAKRNDQVLLITDSNIGAGLADGVYPTDWGYPVKVESGRATRIHDTNHPNHGALAGSSLTMDQGINHLLGWLTVPDAQVWAMGTRNVAAMLGLENKGVIRVGADGDLVLWDRKEAGLCAAFTWVGGECVFDVTRDTVLETR